MFECAPDFEPRSAPAEGLEIDTEPGHDLLVQVALEVFRPALRGDFGAVNRAHDVAVMLPCYGRWARHGVRLRMPATLAQMAKRPQTLGAISAPGGGVRCGT